MNRRTSSCTRTDASWFRTSDANGERLGAELIRSSNAGGLVGLLHRVLGLSPEKGNLDCQVKRKSG
ncbi:hypothetical protein F2Q70_00039609 [Brassica cretica]|uniref:Uncharacterized protein n=1 Tax=Brassica cretica TaxID=69181 RepID=A0A3N6QRZ6_BRACR|nr:hypothetical protein F2Q70_00039609 [Brassica cretica]KAF3493076.1 hypothetical protein DY000_02054210 [Brassica cretica]